MTRKRFYLPRKLSALRKSTVAAAIGLGVALGVVADPVRALEITSGLITASRTAPSQWMLAAPNLSAAGRFREAGGQGPPVVLIGNMGPFGTSAHLSWFADAADGISAADMVFNGVDYFLDGDNVHNSGSKMTLTASEFVIGHVGTYMEPFTFDATLCGFLTVTVTYHCDATVGLSGSGTVDLVVVPWPNHPGAFQTQSISYRFAGVPEPASMALFLTGLVGLALRRRRGV